MANPIIFALFGRKASPGRFDRRGLPSTSKSAILLRQARFGRQGVSGRGAAWIARLTGGQKVAGSNPVAPTRKPRRSNELRRGFLLPVKRFSLGATAKTEKEPGQNWALRGSFWGGAIAGLGGIPWPWPRRLGKLTGVLGFRGFNLGGQYRETVDCYSASVCGVSGFCL